MRIFTIVLFMFSWFTTFGQQNSVEVINGTFLGNEKRNFYGNEAPSRLDVLWKTDIGGGITNIASKGGAVYWKGCGWTGQPLLVKENDTLYVLQGSFDHTLKKINAETGAVAWEYEFDDIIKGTGSVYHISGTENSSENYLILQGSRLGNKNTTHSAVVPSYRGIYMHDGSEAWQMDVRKTRSYSRDVDGSALAVGDTVYLGLENSTFIGFNPDPSKTELRNNLNQPEVYFEKLLYKAKDVKVHGGNLVMESSPCLLNDKIYFTSGSGYVFGYNPENGELDWQFFIGSDMDGSAVVTRDNALLVPVEKQYIEGHGGIFKLDPSKDPDSSVVWYYPVGNSKLSSWDGGVIGSPAVNDETRPEGYPSLAAFHALDSNIYVVDYTRLEDESITVKGPDNKKEYRKPALVWKTNVGPSISTPLFVGNKLITTGYWGVRVYEYDAEGNFRLLDHFPGSAFESTPVVHNGRLYIGGKTGFLYCLGEE